MDALLTSFSTRNSEGVPTLVTFVTAGYPTPDDTIAIMLGMQAGGAGVIELGVPFSDPIADGPTIQATHSIALDNKVEFEKVLELLRSARKQGLYVPVVLMGYYDSVLAHGEDKAIHDAAEAGANGFIIVDLPLEEISSFREKCRNTNIAYVPLIAPTATIQQIKFLASIADGFLYVISKIGTTGSTDNIPMNTDLPNLIARVREHTAVPLAVGFGVATREHFNCVAAAGADGVVIGSRIITVMKTSPPGDAAKNVELYCRQICGK